jgi:hypothetical protein
VSAVTSSGWFITSADINNLPPTPPSVDRINLMPNLGDGLGTVQPERSRSGGRANMLASRENVNHPVERHVKFRGDDSGRD